MSNNFKIIVTVFLLHFLPVTHGDKFGVNCTTEAIDAQVVRRYNDLQWARNVLDCDLNCKERYSYIFLCYSDVTWQVSGSRVWYSLGVLQADLSLIVRLVLVAQFPWVRRRHLVGDLLLRCHD